MGSTSRTPFRTRLFRSPTRPAEWSTSGKASLASRLATGSTRTRIRGGSTGPRSPTNLPTSSAARRLGRIHDLHEAVPVPDALSEVEASTLPIAALAAWFALVEVGSLKPDQVILTQGTGGVSIFAAQIAQALEPKSWPLRAATQNSSA